MSCVSHRFAIIDGTQQTRQGQPFVMRLEGPEMYVLTIVFLVSQVSITSLHASKEACEQAAERARLTAVGPQAVASAKCEPQVLAASR